MPKVKGSVGNKLVTLHRDTQFSGAFIRKEHEFEKQLTGTSQRCKLADGCIIDADVARINVDTPYFTGSVDVWCLIHLHTTLFSDIFVNNWKRNSLHTNL